MATVDPTGAMRIFPAPVVLGIQKNLLFQVASDLPGWGDLKGGEVATESTIKKGMLDVFFREEISIKLRHSTKNWKKNTI